MYSERAINEFVNFVIELDDFPLNMEFDEHTMRRFLYATIYDSDFEITLNQLSMWIGTTESNLKKTLIKSYIDGVDYQIEFTNKLKGGRSKENIYLTSDCLKRLCLRSKSPKAEQIRSYFILIEEMYKEYIIQSIEYKHDVENSSSDSLTSIKKNIEYPNGPCVYVISIKNNDEKIIYKIGRTKNLTRRYKEHLNSIPGIIGVEHYELFRENKFLETCIQSFLSDFQIDVYSHNNKKLIEIYNTDLKTIVGWFKKCTNFRNSTTL